MKSNEKVIFFKFLAVSGVFLSLTSPQNYSDSALFRLRISVFFVYRIFFLLIEAPIQHSRPCPRPYPRRVQNIQGAHRNLGSLTSTKQKKKKIVTKIPRLHPFLPQTHNPRKSPECTHYTKKVKCVTCVIL